MASIGNQIKDWVRVNASVGLFVRLSGSDSFIVDFVELKKEKKLIQVTRSGNDTPTTALQGKQNACYLCIDGPGVIHKKVTRSDNLELSKLVKSSIPQIDPDELFYQYTPISSSEGFLSVIRKNLLEEVFRHLSETRLLIQKVSLGPFPINTFLSFTEGHTTITTPYHTLNTSSTIESFELNSNGNHESKHYEFIGEYIESELLLPYCCALQHFIPNNSTLSSHSTLTRAHQREFLFFSIMKRSIAIVPFILFVILLINFVLFSYYQSENRELTVQNSIKLSETSKINALREELAQKEELISELETKASGPITYYADQLAASLVDGIKLTTLEVYPLDSRAFNLDQSYVFQPGLIKIAGLCTNPQALSGWLNAVNSLAWVETISSPEYSRNELLRKGQFEFTISTR